MRATLIFIWLPPMLMMITSRVEWNFVRKFAIKVLHHIYVMYGLFYAWSVPDDTTTFMTLPYLRLARNMKDISAFLITLIILTFSKKSIACRKMPNFN